MDTAHTHRMTNNKQQNSVDAAGPFKLTSSAFANNRQIPQKFTCKGDNISPALQIFNVPPETQSLALIMHDPDAPVGDFAHWVAWDIPPQTQHIPEGKPIPGATEGVTSFNTNGYGGPCPPSGTHHYIFDLYALDSELDLPKSADRRDLEHAMQLHILDQTDLVGLFHA